MIAGRASGSSITFCRIQAIRLELPRQQILPADRQLLVIQISGDPNDLHSVPQRLRNSVQLFAVVMNNTCDRS